MSPGYRLTAKRLWAAVVIAGLAAAAGVSPVAASSGPRASRAPRPSLARTYTSKPYVSTAKQWSAARVQRDGAINVTYSGIHGAAGYDIYRSTAAGTQGTKVNTRPVGGLFYVDRTAQAGTTYYYTVVALPHTPSGKGALQPNQLASSVTFAQVQASKSASKVAVNASANPKAMPKAHSGTSPWQQTVKAATGFKGAAITTKRLTPRSAVSGACVVAMPHDVSGNETNFGCGSATTIVLWPNLSFNGRNPDVPPSRATCPDNTSANTDCDVHIQPGAVETITAGTSVYVWAGQAEDTAPTATSSDPTQGVDIIVGALGQLKSVGTATSGQGILFDSVNSLLGSAAPSAPAPGDWGDIAFQAPASLPATGAFAYTSVKYGNEFAVNGAPLNLSHDNFVNLSGASPLDQDQWVATPNAAVLEATDQANANPTLDSLSVVINGGSSAEGIAIWQVGAMGNNLGPTISNTTVTGSELGFDIEGWNDLSAGPVTQNVTANLLGDTTAATPGDGAFIQAHWFGSSADTGDDNVTLNIQNSNLAGSNNNAFTAGAVVFAESDEGSGTIGGQVLNSTLSGWAGTFTDAYSDSVNGAGNAAETVTVSNSKLQGTNPGTTYSFAAWNVGDLDGDGPLAPNGSGNANLTPTFNNDTFTGPAGSFAAFGAAFGSGQSTVAPTVSGGSMSNARNPYFAYSATNGAGSSMAGGEMNGTTVTTTSGNAYEISNTGFGGGDVTTDPVLQNDSLTSQDGSAYSEGTTAGSGAATIVTPPSVAVTSDPQFIGSTLLSWDASTIDIGANNDLNGSLTADPSVSRSNVSATYAGEALTVVGTSNSSTTGSSGQANVSPIVNSSLLESTGDAVVDAESISFNNADALANPQVSGADLKGLDDNFGDTAEGVFSLALTFGSGAAVSNGVINQGSAAQPTRVVSSSSALDTEALAVGSGAASSNPTVNQGSSLTNSSAASWSLIYAQTYGGGPASSVPVFNNMTLDLQGIDQEVHSSGAGDVHLNGAFTNSSITDENNDGYFGLAESGGQNAAGNGPTGIADPSFVNDQVKSTSADGIVVVAEGEGNPADNTHSSGSYTALANVALSNVTSDGTGIDAESVDDNSAFAGSATDYFAHTESIANNVSSFDQAFYVLAESNDTSGQANTVLHLYNSNGDSRNGDAIDNFAVNGSTGPVFDTTNVFSNNGTNLKGQGGYGFLTGTESDNNAATTNITWDGEALNSQLGIFNQNLADFGNPDNTDKATINAAEANIANSGGSGMFVENFGGDPFLGLSSFVSGVSDTEMNIAQLTETDLADNGLVVLTQSNGDIGNVKVEHSTIGNAVTTGNDHSGVIMESLVPDTSTPLVAWIQGNSLYNLGGDGVDLYSVVPEVVGNDIWNANLDTTRTECFSSGAPCGTGVYVSGDPGTTHLIAQRPVPNPTLNGTVDANFIHENRWGVWLEFDNGVNPDVRFNDFAGALLSTNNPQDDLVVNNGLPTNATQNWWGSTDTSVSGDIDNSCYTAGDVTGSCLDSASNVAVLPIQTSASSVSGYTLDAYGAIHQYGGAVPMTAGGYWPGRDLARGIAMAGDGLGGYTLDAYGGIHPFGNAPAVVPGGYWPNWDIARGIALVPGNGSTPYAGYTVDGWGGIHPFGGAPAVTATAYYPGWNVIRGIVVNPFSHANTCVSGYTLDAFGGVHPFADTTSAGCSLSNIPSVPVNVPHFGYAIARGIGIQAYGQGYVLDGLGGLHEFGGAVKTTPSGYWNFDIARGINVTTLGNGYVVDGYGGVHPFGVAPPVNVSGYWPNWDIVRGID